VCNGGPITLFRDWSRRPLHTHYYPDNLQECFTRPRIHACLSLCAHDAPCLLPLVRGECCLMFRYPSPTRLLFLLLSGFYAG
jgi:hypothetical protein